MIKKYFNILFAGFLCTSLVAVALASGGSIALTSPRTTYAVGELVTITVFANPNGNYPLVGRANFTYPQDLLEPVGFRANSAQYPNISPQNYVSGGSASIAAFRLEEGTDAAGSLGTVTFKVKAVGTATLSILSGTHLIDADQVNVMGSASGITLTLVPAEKPKLAPPVVKSTTHPLRPAAEMVPPVVDSDTHPEDETPWYRDPNAILYWDALEGVEGYALVVSEDADTDPGDEIDTTGTTFEFKDLEKYPVGDGRWFFRIKAKYPDGFSPVTTYVVQLDETPPKDFPVTMETIVNDKNEKEYHLVFYAEDEMSGVKDYDLRREELDKPEVVKSPYVMKASDFNHAGLYVTAVDKAGNRTVSIFGTTSAGVAKMRAAAVVAPVTSFGVTEFITSPLFIILSILFLLLLCDILMRFFAGKKNKNMRRFLSKRKRK
ncbi:cohesin domain-containing protein [Patescibacteria group bacterium]|nr:cohesin domain-containing protein [Patescibacteria group bacterium]MBU1703141.1 cohesin domain-containing protein [Patescibacteria group bacterium]MBU1954143.1 cohesin domain-containing protein [Patescibacteria group bacterium]